jgi:hypothetical protein
LLAPWRRSSRRSSTDVKNNECLDAALAALEEAGVRDVVVVPGGKHPQLQWRVNGRGLRAYSLPGTSSDRRAPRNVRADVRRILRQDGLIEVPTPKPTPSSRKVDRVTALERRVSELERRILGTEH